MKQRLAIALAVMHDPELLILDEPINGLDPIGIAEVRDFIRALCDERARPSDLQPYPLRRSPCWPTTSGSSTTVFSWRKSLVSWNRKTEKFSLYRVQRAGSPPRCSAGDGCGMLQWRMSGS